MKILHFLLFLSVAGFPQTAWEVINPLPQEKTINAVQIIKDSLVYAAGENGAFLHSNDYGITWQRKPQGVEKTFLSIYFADEMTGWLGAGGGELYRTTDGGYNFNVVQTFPGRDIIKIKLNGNSGYACSREGELYRTNDGFSTYTVRVITNTEVISDILIRENGKGVAAGEDGGIYTTANEGETWVKSAYTAQGPLYGVAKIDNNRTAVYGFNGYLAVSSDDGVNWITQNVGNSNLSSVEVTAGGEIVAANVTGEIYISRDAGITWEVSLSGDDVSYRTMAVSGYFIFAAGEYGVMSARTNNGTDWSYRSTGSRIRFNKIRFVDPNYGFIIGDKGLLLVTSDGGNTWEKKNTGTTREIFDFHLFKNGQGAIGIWLVGANGTHLQSSDTGKTFVNGAMASVVGQNLRTIFMGDNLSRIAGDAGTSYESLGRWGSSGWRKAGNYGSNINFYDFWATTPSIGFLVGTQGTIIRYYYYFRAVAQENISWEVPYELRSVFFIDQKFGWIVGESGVVLGTSDGGHFAQRTNLPVTYLNSVHFINRETGLTVGANGKIFKSTNYGLNWRELPSGVTFTLHSVYMMNANKIYIAGANGLLMKSESGGELPSQAEREFVSEYKNSISVYPNPVTGNPAAGKPSYLEIELGAETSYSVTIYSSLGRQVAEIDSGEKPAGKYLIPFEPENYELSSGAYFAVLRTDSGNSTVKILYLK